MRSQGLNAVGYDNIMKAIANISENLSLTLILMTAATCLL